MAKRTTGRKYKYKPFKSKLTKQREARERGKQIGKLFAGAANTVVGVGKFAFGHGLYLIGGGAAISMYIMAGGPLPNAPQVSLPTITLPTIALPQLGGSAPPANESELGNFIPSSVINALEEERAAINNNGAFAERSNCLLAGRRDFRTEDRALITYTQAMVSRSELGARRLAQAEETGVVICMRPGRELGDANGMFDPNNNILSLQRYQDLPAREALRDSFPNTPEAQLELGSSVRVMFNELAHVAQFSNPAVVALNDLDLNAEQYVAYYRLIETQSDAEMYQGITQLGQLPEQPFLLPINMVSSIFPDAREIQVAYQQMAPNNLRMDESDWRQGQTIRAFLENTNRRNDYDVEGINFGCRAHGSDGVTDAVFAQALARVATSDDNVNLIRAAGYSMDQWRALPNMDANYRRVLGQCARG